MIRHWAAEAGIPDQERLPHVSRHRHYGKLEVAQQMANHESARATSMFDRRNDPVSLDEVERILI